MANVKENKNPNTSTVKELPAKTVRANIDAHCSQIALGLAGLHADMVQCMLHAEKHGDITLAEHLMQSVKDKCKGVVVAGVAQWFDKFSPVKLTSTDGVVKAELLKEGDKGYKPFQSAEAEATPAMESKEVGARANRPITKPTIGYFKKRIAGFINQVDNFNKEAPENERMTDQEVKITKLWLNSVSDFGAKVTVMADMDRTPAPAQGAIPAALQAASKARKTRGTKADDQLKSKTKVA